MDPTISSHNSHNPFVSSSAGVLPSELSVPKDEIMSASAVGPDAVRTGTTSAGVEGIAPLTSAAPSQYSGYSGLGNVSSNTGTAPGAGAGAPYQSHGQNFKENYTAQDTPAPATARDTAQDVSSRASATAQDVSSRVGSTTQDLTHKANATAQDTAAGARNLADKASATANDAATGLRQRVKRLSVSLDNAADHPAVKNARGVAERNVSQLREQLGRSKTIRELEHRTGVDRVVLVVGGVLGYLLLVPLNLFGLALPITNILTILPAAYLSAAILNSSSSKADASASAGDERVKQLLAYFVVLGLIQTTESLAAGVLERRIPQYYTVKLLALAYLLHPQTNGAMQVHENVFRPIVQRASAGSKYPSSSSSSSGGVGSGRNTASTPPTTSKSSPSAFNSPAPGGTAQTSGFATADASGSLGTVPVVVQVPLTAQMEDSIRAQQQQQQLY